MQIPFILQKVVLRLLILLDTRPRSGTHTRDTIEILPSSGHSAVPSQKVPPSALALVPSPPPPGRPGDARLNQGSHRLFRVGSCQLSRADPAGAARRGVGFAQAPWPPRSLGRPLQAKGGAAGAVPSPRPTRGPGNYAPEQVDTNAASVPPGLLLYSSSGRRSGIRSFANPWR